MVFEMQFALNETGDRISANPKNRRGICIGCGKEVIAKCGDIKIWHWAHQFDLQCDKWKEPESLWHRKWKEVVPEKDREVVFGEHRADAVYKNWVIEFQKSQISISDAIAREDHYKNMFWVIFQRWQSCTVFENGSKPILFCRHLARLLACLRAPVFVDVPEKGVFRVTGLSKHSIYGYFIQKKLLEEIDLIMLERQPVAAIDGEFWEPTKADKEIFINDLWAEMQNVLANHSK